MGDELPDYDTIISWIHQVPVTWLGGILAEVAVRTAEVPVFKSDEMMMKFIERAIARERGEL